MIIFLVGVLVGIFVGAWWVAESGDYISEDHASPTRHDWRNAIARKGAKE
jgi:hypothetical protein